MSTPGLKPSCDRRSSPIRKTIFLFSLRGLAIGQTRQISLLGVSFKPLLCCLFYFAHYARHMVCHRVAQTQMLKLFHVQNIKELYFRSKLCIAKILWTKWSLVWGSEQSDKRQTNPNDPCLIKTRYLHVKHVRVKHGMSTMMSIWHVEFAMTAMAHAVSETAFQW